MLSLRDTSSMQQALKGPLDPTLKCLLAKRMEQLGRHYSGDLGELVHFVIVEPGDQLATITAATGFPLTTNLVDGACLGDPDFEPSYEWLEDHGDFFELAYVLSDSGFGTVVFVPDDPGIEFDLHMLCLEYAGRPY